jgi:hypothetical protein
MFNSAIRNIKLFEMSAEVIIVINEVIAKEMFKVSGY